MNIIDSFLKLTNMPDYYNYAHFLTMFVFNALYDFAMVNIWEHLLVRRYSKFRTIIYAYLIEQPLAAVIYPFVGLNTSLAIVARISFHFISVFLLYKDNKRSFAFYVNYLQGTFLFYGAGFVMTPLFSVIAAAVYPDFANLVTYFTRVFSPGFFAIIFINVIEVFCTVVISVLIINALSKIKGSRGFKEKSGLMLLPLYQMIIFVILFSFYTEEAMIDEFKFRVHGILFITVLLSVIVDISVYKTWGIIERKTHLEHQLSLIEELQNAGFSEYKQLELNYRKERIFHHDINNKLIAIRGLMTQGHQEEAAGLMDELSRSVSYHKKYCENPLINILLENKISYAAQMGIDFEINASVGELAVKKTDLCSVVSNILDNAIEACGNLPEGLRRLIVLDIYTEKSYFIIRCKNPYGTAAQESRSGRGHGLMILQQIADAYEGQREIKTGDGYFEITVLLFNGEISIEN